jgi:hypothetical protein
VNKESRIMFASIIANNRDNRGETLKPGIRSLPKAIERTK